MQNENQKLLEEIYKATKMGIKATQIISPKVRNPELKQQIDRQGDNYKGMSAKAQRMLENTGKTPKSDDEMQEAMLWGSITLNTMINKKPSHIASMLINGTTMGIVDMTKKLNELDSADAGSKKLAEEYIANEQNNIEELKKHL